VRNPISSSFLSSPLFESSLEGFCFYFSFWLFSSCLQELYKALIVYFVYLAMAGLRQDGVLDVFAEVEEQLLHQASYDQSRNNL
jgi:hypothetical protein